MNHFIKELYRRNFEAAPKSRNLKHNQRKLGKISKASRILSEKIESREKSVVAL